MNNLILVVIAVIISVTHAAYDARLLRYENDYGLGNYRFYFEQSDETRHEQVGELKNAGSANAFIVVRGFYSWLTPEGILKVVKYFADENGYRATEEEGPGALPPRIAATLVG